jgi:GAF domain-containing protein
LEYKKAEKQILSITNNSLNVLQDVVDFIYNNFNHYNWVGIYVVQGNDLLLKSWKGPNATEHTKIPVGKGVCGSVAKSGKTEVVDDVHSDNRYLACFLSTKSEIVVPIKKDNKIVGEIDIDSNKISAFTLKDKKFLEKIADMLTEHIL